MEFFLSMAGERSEHGIARGEAPVVLSMTQQLPLSYTCIGNVGYGTGFDPPMRLAPARGDCESVQPAAGSVFPGCHIDPDQSDLAVCTAMEFWSAAELPKRSS